MNFQDIYKNNMLAEGRLDDIKARYSDKFSSDHIDEVIDKALPDNDKKHVDWIMKHYANGNIKASDFSATKRFLDVYEKNKSKIGRGLGSVNGLKDLREIVRPYTNVGLTKEQRLAKNKKTIYEDHDLLVEQHKGHEACEAMGWLPKDNPHYDSVNGKARWCISLGNGENKKFLRRYTENNRWPVQTITTKKDKRKYALVLNENESTPEFRDEHDRMVDPANFIANNPSILSSSTGEFITNSINDDELKDFIHTHLIDKPTPSANDLHEFYKSNTGDSYISGLNRFIGKHPNTSSKTLHEMADSFDVSPIVALSHPNYDVEEDLNHQLNEKHINDSLLSHSHLKPHHIDKLLSSGLLSHDDASTLASNKNANFTSPQIKHLLSQGIVNSNFYNSSHIDNEVRKQIIDSVFGNSSTALQNRLLESPYSRHPEIVNHLLSKNYGSPIDNINMMNRMINNKVADSNTISDKIVDSLANGVNEGKIEDTRQVSLINLKKRHLHDLYRKLNTETDRKSFVAHIMSNVQNGNINDKYSFMKEINGKDSFANNNLSVDSLNELDDENAVDAVSQSSGHRDLLGRDNKSGFYTSMGKYLNFSKRPKLFDHVVSNMKLHGGDFRDLLSNNTLTPEQYRTTYDNTNKHTLYPEYVKNIVNNNNTTEDILNDLHANNKLLAPNYKNMYGRDDLSEEFLKSHLDQHMNTIIRHSNDKKGTSARVNIESILSSPSAGESVATHFIKNYATKEGILAHPDNAKYGYTNTKNHVMQILDKLASTRKYGSIVKNALADKDLLANTQAVLMKNKSTSGNALHSLVVYGNNHIVRNNYDSLITNPNLKLKTLNYMIDKNLIPEADKNHALRVFHEKAGQQLLPFRGIKK